MPRRPSEIEISLDTMPQMPIGDGVRRDLPAAVGEEVLVLPLADVDAAAAAADDHAGVGLTGAQPGVAPRLAAGDHAEERGARIAFGDRRVVQSAASSPSSATAAAMSTGGTAAATRHGVARGVERR